MGFITVEEVAMKRANTLKGPYRGEVPVAPELLSSSKASVRP